MDIQEYRFGIACFFEKNVCSFDDYFCVLGCVGDEELRDFRRSLRSTIVVAVVDPKRATWTRRQGSCGATGRETGTLSWRSPSAAAGSRRAQREVQAVLVIESGIGRQINKGHVRSSLWPSQVGNTGFGADTLGFLLLIDRVRLSTNVNVNSSN